MSLTFLFRMLAFLFLITPAAMLGTRYGPELADYLAGARGSTIGDTRIASRSIVYRIDGHGPVDFTFSQPVDLVKVIAQPSVRPEMHDVAGGVVYGFRVDLLDTEGQVIKQHDIYLHADSPDETYASGTRWRFFRNRPELIAAQDEVLVASDPRAASARFSALPSDDGVVGVDLRVYEQRPFLGQQAIDAFRRRSAAEQADLAAANAFPPDMLTVEEMNHIGRNQWRPVGPTGIAGRDYLALVLYEGSKPTQDIGPEGGQRREGAE